MRLQPIIPSILGVDKESTYFNLPLILKSGVINAIHIDAYSDGIETSYFNSIANLKELAEILGAYGAAADIHLLSDLPMDMDEVRRIVNMKLSIPMRISIHVGKGVALQEFTKICREAGISPGLAIKLKTPTPLARETVDEFEYMHFICNNENDGLNSFQMSVLEKVASFHAIFPEKQVLMDCGIKAEHIESCIRQGATNLIMGSAIFKNKEKTPSEIAIEYALKAAAAISKNTQT